MTSIRLGLIGDNIKASRAPALHRLAARLCGLDLSYELLIPGERELGFDTVFDGCIRDGYRGINVTLPYKERVVTRLAIEDDDVRAIGACNTVVFDADPPRGLNTDFTGFIQAYRGTFGTGSPGLVAMAGAGGVGRAIGFALAQLGASALRIFDVRRAKAEALAAAIASVHPTLRIEVAETIEQAASGADGLVNCTPLGMVGYGGCAFPRAAIGGQSWAFDAVYTPLDTDFVLAARGAGLAVMSGYELYFWQGVDAFRIFTRQAVDPALLRRELAKNESGAAA